MNHIVEFCTNNMHHGTADIVRRLEARPDVDAIEYGCLGHCGLCFLEPYALVDGEYVSADTAEQLYERIIRKLEAEEDDPFADLPLD